MVAGANRRGGIGRQPLGPTIDQGLSGGRLNGRLLSYTNQPQSRDDRPRIISVASYRAFASASKQSSVASDSGGIIRRVAQLATE